MTAGRIERRWRQPVVALLLAGGALGGCSAVSSAAGGTPVGAAPTPSTEARARIEAAGRVPSEADMDPAVRLVTFQKPSIPGGVMRRDTVLGPEAVSRWLLALYSEQLPEVEFGLDTYELLLCREAVIQRGTYELRAAAPGSPVVQYPFLARWVQDGVDGLRMEALWLDPVPRVRPGSLASRCRPDLIDGPERFGLSLESGLALSADRGAMVRAMKAAGWTNTVQTDDGQKAGPHIEAGMRFPPLTLRGSYRLSDARGAVLIATRWPASRVYGRYALSYSTSLTVGPSLAVGVLASASRGPLEAAVGPGLAAGTVTWFQGDEPYHEPRVRRSHVRAGAIGHIASRMGVSPGLELAMTVEYAAFPGVDTPAYPNIEPFKLPLRHGRAGMGATWRF